MHLTTSKAMFCGAALQKAFYIPLEEQVYDNYRPADSKFDCSSATGSGSFGDCSDDDDATMTNLFRTVQDTCVNEPEITGDVETCYDRGDDTYVRFACSGQIVYQQYCEEDKDCENKNCEDYPWVRVYHGGVIDDADDNLNPGPFYYPRSQGDGLTELPDTDIAMGRVIPALAGTCHWNIDVTGHAGELGSTVDGDCDKNWFLAVGVFGCLDEEVDSDNIWIWESYGNAGGGASNPLTAESKDESYTDFDENLVDLYEYAGREWNPLAYLIADDEWFPILTDGALNNGAFHITSISSNFYETQENGKKSENVLSNNFANLKIHRFFTFHQEDLGDYPFLQQWVNWRVNEAADYLSKRQNFDQFYVPWMATDECAIP